MSRLPARLKPGTPLYDSETSRDEREIVTAPYGGGAENVR